MKCSECFREHPPNDWPWAKFPKPVYWTLPDDGDGFHCKDCDEKRSHKQVILTQIPCGHREVICTLCIDEYWMTVAQYLGLFKE